MYELTFICWSILAFVSGIVFLFTARYRKRKLKKYAGFQKIGLMVLSALLGWLTFYFVGQSPHIGWVVRLVVLALGGLSLWVTYLQTWPKRDQQDYQEDSFLVEYLYFQFSAFLACTFLFLAPILTTVIAVEELSKINNYWALPVVFLLPFLIRKVFDFAIQRPFRYVEVQWDYPLEALNVEKIPWENFMQVNFRLKGSLEDEYRLFSPSAKPWIEAPKEMTLADAFRMTIQERSKRTELTSIQDLGNTYTGAERFWWLFSLRIVWWNPLTWFRKPRYLNPKQSLNRIQLKKGDTIVARRIPYGAAYAIENFTSEEDHDKTVIIRR